MESPMNKTKHLAIQLEDYEYQCGDGCCTDYGTVITVNGSELFADGYIRENLLLAVLTHLGFSVSIEQIVNDETVCVLEGLPEEV